MQPTGKHVSTALERLEGMMAELQDGRNICLNYNFEHTPDVNSAMGTPRHALNMIESNLAVRLVPDFNKIVPQQLLNDAMQSMSLVSAKSARDNIRDVQAPSRMPIGSGHRYGSRYQRFNRPEDLPPISCATNNMHVNEVEDFVEHFEEYLNTENIASFTIESTNGLIINTSSNTDTDVFYNIKARDPENTRISNSVLITVTTNTNRVVIRKVDFSVTKLKIEQGT